MGSHVDFLARAVDEVRRVSSLDTDYPDRIVDAERRALYARDLFARFDADAFVLNKVQTRLEDNAPFLERLLATKGLWSGELCTLTDAMMLGYGGFHDLDAIRRFEFDLKRNIGTDAGFILGECEIVMGQAGLRAPWVAAALLAGWLHHALWRRHWAFAGLPAARLAFWPAESRDVTTLPPEVRVAGYDPTVESLGRARRRSQTTFESQAKAATEQADALGYGRFRDARRVERDAHITYLRLTSPDLWTWSNLARGFFSKPGATSSPRAAVERVVMLLDIELPPGTRGRPPVRKEI